MSRALLRSALELRTPVTRLPPAFLLPIRARFFNSTAHTEPTQHTEAVASQPPRQSITKQASALSSSNPTAPASQTSDAAAAAAAAPPAPAPAGPLSESVRSLLPLLASQPGHYITINIHGRPYLVTPGDSVRLPFKMPGVVPGDVLRFNRASVLGSRDFTLKGAPYVDERLYECRAVVLGTESEPLRLKIKKKRRIRRKKTVMSKHKYTVLRISELKINRPDEVEGA